MIDASAKEDAAAQVRIQTLGHDLNHALARALSVVHDLVGRGLDPMRLSASGLGQFQPLDPANTAEARAQNRRIELTLTER